MASALRRPFNCYHDVWKRSRINSEKRPTYDGLQQHRPCRLHSCRLRGCHTPPEQAHSTEFQASLCTWQHTFLPPPACSLPPLLGFWSKFLYLFISTIEIAPWLTLIAIANTGLSIGYYGQVIRYILSTKTPDQTTETTAEKLSNPSMIAVLKATVLTIVLGLGIAPIMASLLQL